LGTERGDQKGQGFFGKSKKRLTGKEGKRERETHSAREGRIHSVEITVHLLEKKGGKEDFSECDGLEWK